MSVKELHDNGTMNFLLQHGLITPSNFRKMEIFIEVKNQEMQGKKHSHAVEDAAKICRVCERTVWRAVNMFQENY